MRRTNVARLITSINRRLPPEEKLEETLLEKSFDVWWPQLKIVLDALPPEIDDERRTKAKKETSHKDAILEELLELARNQQKLLHDPEALLPPSYLRDTVRSGIRGKRSPLSRDFHKRILRVEHLLNELKSGLPDPSALAKLEEEIDGLYRFTHEDDLKWIKRRKPVDEWKNGLTNRRSND